MTVHRLMPGGVDFGYVGSVPLVHFGQLGEGHFLEGASVPWDGHVLDLPLRHKHNGRWFALFHGRGSTYYALESVVRDELRKRGRHDCAGRERVRRCTKCRQPLT